MIRVKKETIFLRENSDSDGLTDLHVEKRNEVKEVEERTNFRVMKGERNVTDTAVVFHSWGQLCRALLIFKV